MITCIESLAKALQTLERQSEPSEQDKTTEAQKLLEEDSDEPE